MKLFDVNILIYAFRQDLPEHAEIRPWFEAVIQSDEAFGMADLVFSGFLRVVTNSKPFPNPSTPQDAMAFVERLRMRANCVILNPGPRHWGIFEKLHAEVNAKGNDVPDAYFAALAIEHGCEWITNDRGFSRYPGLNWSLPDIKGTA